MHDPSVSSVGAKETDALAECSQRIGRACKTGRFQVDGIDAVDERRRARRLDQPGIEFRKERLGEILKAQRVGLKGELAEFAAVCHRQKGEIDARRPTAGRLRDGTSRFDGEIVGFAYVRGVQRKIGRVERLRCAPRQHPRGYGQSRLFAREENPPIDPWGALDTRT